VTRTPFGEIVLRHGERAAAEFHELMREVALAKGLEIGELRIAAGPYPADISGERAIGVLSARHPNLAIELRIANYTRVLADVGEGAVDLGFAEVSEAENDPNFDVQSSGSRELSFFCSAQHPLAGKRPLAIEHLLDFPWVGPSIAGRLRKALPVLDKPFGRFDELEDRFHPRILVETFSAAKRIVLGGTRHRRRGPVPDRVRAQGGTVRHAAGPSAPAQSQLRLHRQTRPDPLARCEGVHRDRPGDRAGNPDVSDGLA
jgi:DNA-binding transcriptional LysR family regulator